MKALLTVLALTLIFGGSLRAQADVRQELKRLDLTEAQMKQVVAVVRETQGDLDKARAEAKVTQAKLARLLVDDNPSRPELEKLVREGSEWDYRIKMVRIDRSLKLRAIVGKDRWAVLSSLGQKLLEAEKNGKHPILEREGDKGPLKDLLPILKDLN